MNDEAFSLATFLDAQFGNEQSIEVEPMLGGGSCEIFNVRRGAANWVLRRAPLHASSSTAHDVLREFRILDAIKDERVAIARPIIACADPAVFGGPFYLMEHVAGVPIRAGVPASWAASPEAHGAALAQLHYATVDVPALDWAACGLGDRARPERYPERQLERWKTQLHSYGGRELSVADELPGWLSANRPADRPLALCHGDYKL